MGSPAPKNMATLCTMWSAYSAPVGASPGQQFLLSGGTDRAIRLLELNRVAESLVVTPPSFTYGYSASATSAGTAGGLYGNQTRAVSLVQRPVLGERREAGVEYAEEQTLQVPPPAASAGAARTSASSVRAAAGTGSAQQQQVHPAAPMTHTDSVTALALARPSNHHTQVFILSASADGVLNIWK